MLTLQWTSPANRTSKYARQPPKCFPMDDKDKVKLIGSQNQVVHHAIATQDPSAQTLFDLGLLQAWGFNQLEAANFFQVRG